MKTPKNTKQYMTFPAALIIGLLLILVVSGVYFRFYLNERIYEERTTQLNEITSQVYVNLNNTLNVHWLYLTFAINMLEGYEPDTMEEAAAYIGELERILETASRDSELLLLDSQGNCYDDSGYRGVWTDVSILASGEDRYSFVSDSFIYQGNYWKFVQKLNTPIHTKKDDVSFTHILLLRNMQTLTSYFDSGAYGGHNQTYILKSDGTRMSESLFEDRLIQSYNVIDSLENMEGQRYSDIRVALEETDMLSSNFTYDGEEYYYCITSLESYGAILLFLIPARFVATETVKMVTTIVWTLLILVTAALILLVLAVVSTLRRRSSAKMALQEQANRLQQEELNAQLEESKKAVERSLKEAEDANKAKSAFLSNMSHEIRTPINAVLGMNEMILREAADESLLSYAANIQSSGKTLLFLINDILDMSKIESGKMEIVPVEYETAGVIIDLWNGIYLRAQDKGLNVEFFLDETMPQILYGDDVRIKQVVTNLLTNAVKYTSKGGVELHAEYRRTVEGMIDLVISVKDTGMGIREEDMGKLFESFQRIDQEKNRNIEGTGLGMNIVMSLLKLMGGDIKVESEYQKGSTFTVTIPQKVISDEATGDFKSIMSKHRTAASGSKKSFEAPEARVLVVDDNSMNLSVFTALLKRTKMNIVTADSGRKCLELVKEQFYHIIFLDHMMPEMDGIETLHEMRKFDDFPNDKTPVIALTANVFSGARESYLKEGFNDFLTKPIDADLLEKMVVSYLPKELVQIVEQVETSRQQGHEMADEDKKKLARLEQEGFSTQAGLQYCSGDMAFYHDMLTKFARDAEGKITDIQDAFQREDYQDYQIRVHALKSTSKTIGADILSGIAKDMEDAAKERDTAYIKENHEALLAIYRATVQSLEHVLGLGESVSSTQDSPGGTGVSEEELLEYLSRLKESLDTFEADKAETLLQEMDELVYQGSPVSELLHDVRQDVEDFELSAAAEKVEALKERFIP